MKSRLQVCFAFFVAGALPLLTGCQTVAEHTLTGELWEGGAFDYYKSATNAELKLFQRGDDVLVEYTEEREKTGATRQRAYFLIANDERIKRRKKPHFVPVEKAVGMEPIPVETKGVTNSTARVWAEVSDNALGFSLVRDGIVQGEYKLPVYKDTANEVKRLLLTPGTVTVDTVVWGSIVGGVVGAYVAYCYAGGTPNPDYK